MRIPIPATLLLLFFTAPRLLSQPIDSPGTGGAPSRYVLNGRQLAEEVVQAVGGLEAWNDQSWNLSFDFVVERDGVEAARFSHIWNRKSGTYIISGRNREGRSWTVTFSDIHTKAGRATVDGASVRDSVLQTMVEMGYNRFINDTYWLLMPFKLLDPGVNHRYDSDTTLDGKTYQLLQLSFNSVGLTPMDRYWLYINPETKLVERWHYLLQNGREGEFLWTDYQRFGPILLSLRKPATDGSSEIRFEKVQVTGTGK